MLLISCDIKKKKVQRAKEEAFLRAEEQREKNKK